MDVHDNNTYQIDNKSKQTKWTYLLLSHNVLFLNPTGLFDINLLEQQLQRNTHTHIYIYIYMNPFKYQNPMTSYLNHYTQTFISFDNG